MYINLKKYGLNDHIEQEAALYSGLYVARVAQQHRELYKVIGEHQEMQAVVSGKMAFYAESQLEFPGVGDFVMIDRDNTDKGSAIIHHLLTRKSVFVRKGAGTDHSEQVIAANIDTVFICMSLVGDFNLRRLERYLTIAWESMAKPVVVLTKSDLCHDLESKLAEVSDVALGAAIVACSAENSEGMNDIQFYIQPGKTIAFIGSSGVGKSTLINKLFGEEVLATKAVSAGTGKGRHTTTSRQLLLLPGGGMVIDTPGMRELGLFAGDLTKTFEDIEELAGFCKYADCTHTVEPGCAVRQAIKTGVLDDKRFESYQKLQRELSYDGLNSRQLENEKINRMFGGKGEMKQALKYLKKRKS